MVVVEFLQFLIAMIAHWEHDNLIIVINDQSSSPEQLGHALTANRTILEAQFSLVLDASYLTMPELEDLLETPPEQNAVHIIFHLGQDRLESCSRMRSQWFGKYVWLVPGVVVDHGQMNLRLDSRLFGFVALANNKSYEISEFYSVKSGPVTKRVAGVWRSDFGLIFSQEHIWERRKNLTGVVLQNVVLPYPNFNDFHVNSETRKIENETGLFHDIFSMLQDELGFGIESQMPQDGQWGGQNPDGSWTGIVGTLQNRQADITAPD